MCLIKRSICDKGQRGRVPQLEGLGNQRPQMGRRSIERLEDWLKLPSAKRHGESRGILEIGAHPNLRHCHRDTSQPRISQFTTHQDPGKDMANFLANAKLPLASPLRL
jgi:hypothetical protein